MSRHAVDSEYHSAVGRLVAACNRVAGLCASGDWAALAAHRARLNTALPLLRDAVQIVEGAAPTNGHQAADSPDSTAPKGLRIEDGYRMLETLLNGKGDPHA